MTTTVAAFPSHFPLQGGSEPCDMLCGELLESWKVLANCCDWKKPPTDCCDWLKTCVIAMDGV